MPIVMHNSKPLCGKCYFKDGHIENIISYIHYSEEYIVFYTESGKYEYRLWVEPLDYEVLSYDYKHMARMPFPRHAFYKVMNDVSSEPVVVDIDKIELE